MNVSSFAIKFGIIAIISAEGSTKTEEKKTQTESTTTPATPVTNKTRKTEHKDKGDVEEFRTTTATFVAPTLLAPVPVPSPFIAPVVASPEPIPVVHAVAGPIVTHATVRPSHVLDRSEPVFFCEDPGWELEGETCVLREVAATSLACSYGYTLDEGGSGCYTATEYLYTCPEGYVQSAMGCTRTIATEALYNCPEGAFGDPMSGCFREIPALVGLTCPPGSNLHESTASCVSIRQIEPLAYCTDGYQMMGDGTCLRGEQYDCTMAAVPFMGKKKHHHKGGDEFDTDPVGSGFLPPYSVGPAYAQPAGYSFMTLPGYGGIGGPRFLSESVDQHEAVEASSETDAEGRELHECKECGQKRKKIKLPVIPTVVQQTCNRVVSTPLSYQCPDGSSPRRKHGLFGRDECCVEEAVPASPYCTGASGSVEHCYTPSAVQAEVFCGNPGETLNCSTGRCQCLRTDAAAAVAYCPHTHPMDVGHGCRTVVEVDVVCPPGYIMEGGTCLRELRKKATCIWQEVVVGECEEGHVC